MADLPPQTALFVSLGWGRDFLSAVLTDPMIFRAARPCAPALSLTTLLAPIVFPVLHMPPFTLVSTAATRPSRTSTVDGSTPPLFRPSTRTRIPASRSLVARWVRVRVKVKVEANVEGRSGVLGSAFFFSRSPGGRGGGVLHLRSKCGDQFLVGGITWAEN